MFRMFEYLRIIRRGTFFVPARRTEITESQIELRKLWKAFRITPRYGCAFEVLELTMQISILVETFSFSELGEGLMIQRHMRCVAKDKHCGTKRWQYMNYSTSFVPSFKLKKNLLKGISANKIVKLCVSFLLSRRGCFRLLPDTFSFAY